MTARKRGELVMAANAFFAAAMGIFIRLMGEHFTTIQQIAVRAAIAIFIGFVLLRNPLPVKRMLSLPRKDVIVMLLRTLVNVIGLVCITYAYTVTTFVNVTIISAIPFTALYGVILLGEKLTRRSFTTLFLAFLGAFLTITVNLSNIGTLHLGFGEFIALIGYLLYGLMNILRKYISHETRTAEVTQFGSITIALFALVLSLFSPRTLHNFIDFPLTLLPVMIGAGFLFVVIGIFMNYGYKHLSATSANNISLLSVFFAFVISILLYNEIPTLQQMIGSILIIGSALYNNLAPVAKAVSLEYNSTWKEKNL